MAVVEQTHVPRPDRRPECKANIGLCQSNALWSSINVQLMQHKLHGHLTVQPQSGRYKEASARLHCCQCQRLLLYAYWVTSSQGLHPEMLFSLQPVA